MSSLGVHSHSHHHHHVGHHHHHNQGVQGPQQQQALADAINRAALTPAAPKSVAEQRADAERASINAFQQVNSSSLNTDQMKMALNGAGIPEGVLAKASPAEVQQAYDQLSAATRTPGHHDVGIKIGGKKFKASMDVDQNGKVSNFKMKKKKKKKKGFFSKIKDFAKKGLDFGKNLLGGALDIGKNLLGGLGGILGGGGGGGGGGGFSL